MMKIHLWKIALVISYFVFQVHSSSHWVVTENGRIQSMLDSPFHLRRPYDLLALLDQETRRNEINNIYQDLVLRKSIVDKKSSSLEGASDLEARVYSNDEDCLKAGKFLSEIDLFTSIASNGSDRDGIKYEKFQNNVDENKENVQFKVPDCTKYQDLPFSMFAYEHLNTMKNRKNISLSPEENLKYLMPVTSLKEFGHQLAIGLSKNSSSWLHYNLATLYWRIEGVGLKAIECARRALYFVPRKYKDIPLLNLAGIFHQSRNSKEAAILLHAAIDHDPYQATNYLALGNVYAVLANYNRSINCYDNYLKLQPGLDDVINAKHAILCHKKLESGLLQLHESLQDILSDLHYYHSQQQQWLRLKERLIWEQAPIDTQTRLENLFSNREQRCVQKTTDNSKSTIMCDFIESPLPTGAHVDIISLLRNYESASKKINEHISQVKQSATKVFPKKDSINNKIVFNVNEFKLKDHLPPDGEVKYPTTMSWKNNLYFDETGWPTREECLEWDLPLNEKEDLLLPVFMPPENKGYKVKEMLSEYINIPEDIEHELPWYPPICELSKDEESFFSDGSRELLNENLKSHPYLKKILLSYVNNGNAEEAEIGQRIITAMHKQAGPTWVLATLASLYWRVRSNINNILDCLDLPFASVPRIHADVMFISVGSIFHQMGLVDYALEFATFAFKLNYVEPSTNFLLALIHYTQNNPIRAMYYMKNVLRVEPDYYDGYAEKLLKIWACRIKMGNYEMLKNKKEKPEEICTEHEGGENEEGVICSVNGEMCKTAAIQCFRTDKLQNRIEELSTKVSSNQCLKGKGLNKVLLSSLLSAEGSGGLEPDQSQLESLPDKPSRAFHMKITLDDHTMSTSNALSDFYVSLSLTDDPKPEAVLHVYDKTGTYQLSNFQCGDVQNNDLIDFTTMWESVASRNVDISSLLKPLNGKSNKKNMEPFCFKPYTKIPGFLGQALEVLLNNPLPKIPEKNLFEWLEYMSNDHQSSLEELGAKIKIALQENVTSWVLNTAASIYWRVVGNAKEAAICLQHAMVYAPHDMRDIPLTNLANLLLTYGFRWDSLGVAQAALGIYPNFAVTHYTMGNIFNSLGELEKAITYYRSSLAIDPKFEPSRNKLITVLCTFLLEENDVLKINEN